MNTIEVQGALRQDLGKKAAKAVRREGKIPAVMYGGEEVVHFTTTYKEVKDLI
ncbi:MAG TPA: 50S ribosomal protein L25, partial [Phaeodactylibacter sp.]|nr:50S ribosomal protein L25 [Phaeodactylibacter sp.]